MESFIIHLVGLTAAILLVGIGILHFYWAAGGQWAIYAVIPEQNGKPLFRPGPFMTMLVAMGLFLLALLLLVNLQLVTIPLPVHFLKASTWAAAGIFLLRAIGDFTYVGLIKRDRHTTFARLDTRLYSPLCLYLAIVFGMLAYFAG